MLKLRMNRPALLMVLLSVSLLVGCSGEEPEYPPTFPASGTVTLDGQPVEGATVGLSPNNRKTGRSASGVTDASGNFTLTSFQFEDGAVAGQYTIIVSKIEYDGKVYSAEEAQAYTEEHGTGPPSPDSKELMPEKYTNRNTSDIKVEVTEAGPNEFKVELKK